jgi:hypothetical protein
MARISHPLPGIGGIGQSPWKAVPVLQRSVSGVKIPTVATFQANLNAVIRAPTVLGGGPRAAADAVLGAIQRHARLK